MLNRLNALLDDAVSDVFIGSATGVWLQRGNSVERAPIEVSEDEVRGLAVDLIDQGGRHLDDANPCIDVALPGGVRVHAALWPLSSQGTEISIRIPARNVPTLDDFVGAGSITAPTAEFLRDAVAGKKTFLVTGAAGSGKTTLLRTLLSCVDPSQRIIVIEDTAELCIPHPRAVSLETRAANVEGVGEFGVPELIRQALRMRPDRLVVGECRGADVVDMFIAFTTGHPGGGSTLHATSLSDVSIRLTALTALAGLGASACAALVNAAIDVVIHVSLADGTRRLSIGRPLVGVSGELMIEPWAVEV